MKLQKPRLETRLIHAGEPDPLIHGAVSMPVFQSSTFEYSGERSYHDLRYIRLNNTPNHTVLHNKLAALEGAEAAVVTASGMAAISTVLLTFLRPGDHLLAQDSLYGGTHEFITKDLSVLGIEVDFIPGDDPGRWAPLLRSETKMVYVETITNPLLQVADLSSLAEFARAHALISVIDNTFASPVNFRPPEAGYDLSIHSGTKYLNGHTDIVAGAVIGRADLIDAVGRKLDHLGGCLDPHTCFLLHRGIKTLAVRMAHQNRSAQQIAEFLEGHPAVQMVHYPGIESHPSHERARALLDGFGGMISFEVRGGVAAAERVIENGSIPTLAPSLGGVETLITRPATTSHVGLSREDRERAGISDSLIRLSVGLESTEDLIEDFDRALSGI